MLLRTPIGLAVVALLAACSSSSPAKPAFAQPAESAFHDGPCRAVAPAVLALGKDAHALKGAGRPDAEMSTRLKSNQDAVFAAAPAAPLDVKTALDKLVVTIGIVRIRTDSNTYIPSLSNDLLTSYQAVVTACTS